jgi:hypothetical protein
MRALTVIAVAVGGTLPVVACKEEGTLERAGEKADEAVRDGKRSVEDAAD